MKKLIKRENEYNRISNRDLFESLPPGIDPFIWYKFRHAYNLAAKLIVNECPAQINIGLNSHCNLKCSYCIHGVRNIKKQVLGFEPYKKIIDEAVNFGILSVKLNNMNEPLLLPDLEEYIKYARGAGMVNIFFSTNGILLTPERSVSLINSGLTKIFISIDAINKETYLTQTKSRKFNQVVLNTLNFITIRNDLGLKFPLVRVNFLKNKINQDQENEFIDFWTNKADIVIIQEMYETIDKKSGLLINQEKTNFRCSIPFKLLTVTHDGSILPCCTMHGEKMKLGNISEISLKDAWNSEQMKILQTVHKQGLFQNLSVCRYCVNGT